MSQNLISLNFSAEDIAAIDVALSTLEEKFSQLIELSVEQRRTLAKMGEKTEGVCRQTLMVLAQNSQMIPPGFDLREAENDLANLDLLRRRFSRLGARMGDAVQAERSKQPMRRCGLSDEPQ